MSEKDYKKKTSASLVGFMMFAVLLMIAVKGWRLPLPRPVIVISTIVIRVAISYWVASIASEQNRNKTLWQYAAFFFPSFTLIAIGYSDKLLVNNIIDPAENIGNQISVLRERAVELYNEKRYVESIEILDNILESSNENPELIRFRALAYYHLGDMEKAKKDFEHLYTNKIFIPTAALYLGNIEEASGAYEKAVSFWKESGENGNKEAAKKLSKLG